MATPHSDYDRIASVCAVLAKDAATSWDGGGFRFASLKYASSKDLLSGKGAEIAGGRVNRKGSFCVIYTSTDPQTAMAETYQNFAAFGFSKATVRPMVVVGIQIKLSAVLDLTDARTRKQLEITLKDLEEPWLPIQENGGEALTQAIGRAAYEAGFEAIMLPSVRHKGGVNLNIFPQNVRTGSVVSVMNDDDLQTYLK